MPRIHVGNLPAAANADRATGKLRGFAFVQARVTNPSQWRGR
jgi:hypothetical protein